MSDSSQQDTLDAALTLASIESLSIDDTHTFQRHRSLGCSRMVDRIP